MNQAVKLDRRNFLRGSGLLVVSLGVPLPFTVVADAIAAQSWPVPSNMNSADTFLAIAEDGSVTGFCGHIDMGTGVSTSLAQIIAEEMDVSIDNVTMVLGDTDKTPDQGRTTASETLAFAAIPIRQAAAEARLFLVARAEIALGVPHDQLDVHDGVIYSRREPSRNISYGSLIGGEKLNLEILRNARPKSPDQYRVVGQSIPRKDIPAKLTGTFEYVQDVRVPGMVHGRVILPPTRGYGNTLDMGSSVVSVDEGSVSDIPGLIKVVVKENFVGVVAEREENAIRAAEQLKVEWKRSAALPPMAELDKTLRAAELKPRIMEQSGQVDKTLENAQDVLEAEFFWPFQMHGSIGPSCAVADVRPDTVEIWSGTQNPHSLLADIAFLTERPRDSIRVIRREAAGCYGRNCADDAAADAVLLSEAVGRPVRVQYSRADEHGWEPKGCAATMKLRGTLDAAGNIAGWDFETIYLSNAADTLALVTTGKRSNVGISRGWQGAVHPYSFANSRSVVQEGPPILLRVAWLRGVAAVPNVFAIESFMDELAAKAEADPLEFRLRYLTNRRAIDVLQAAARKARWDARPSPKAERNAGPSLKGRGIAYGHYAHTRAGTLVPGAHVAAVVEVDVERDSGKVRVTKMTVAHDCGLIVNPDGVKHQVHGNAIQMISRTLLEEVVFDQEGVTSLDWATYNIVQFPDIPEIDVVLINRPDEPIDGAGEPASVPIAAAIGNAIFDATGVRYRTVPFTPDRVRQGLGTST